MTISLTEHYNVSVTCLFNSMTTGELVNLHELLAEVSDEAATGQQVAVAAGDAGVATPENSAVVIAQLEARYTATLREQVTEQLTRDPRVNLFSLDHLDTCVVRLPDNMTASDVDDITVVFGSGSLRSLLSGALSMPSDEATMRYVKGEDSGFKEKSREEIKGSLEKLEKIIAFLKALVAVLNAKEKEYRATEDADRQEQHSNKEAANRVSSLSAVLDVLNEIDTRVMKQRMEGLEQIARVITGYLAESATPAANVGE